MLWEVDVHLVDAATDHTARAIVTGAAELGIAACTQARTAVGWLIEGDLARADVERLAARLLADPVTQSFVIAAVGEKQLLSGPAELPTVMHVLPHRQHQCQHQFH